MSLAAWRPRLRTRRAALIMDGVLAGALTAGALVQVPRDHADWLVAVSYLTAIGCTASVAWRRWLPAVAAATSTTAMLCYQLASSDPAMTFEPYAVLLTFYALGRLDRSDRRNRLVTGGLLLYALVVLAECFAHSGNVSFGDVVGGWGLFAVVPYAGGVLIARRAAMTHELATKTAALRVEQRLRAAAIADEERNRVARELHDVITHCVSVMVIQAAAARLIARRDLAAAGSALDVVQRSGREAMADLRRITGVLHRAEAASATTPGIARFDELVERTRAGGLATELRLVGTAVPLSAELDLAAYRVVQEALTNVVKHAGHARARVTVTFDGDDVELRVEDDGAGRHCSAGAVADTGHGLIGMKERVAGLGGVMHAGNRDGGGFEVLARLPIRTAIEPPATAPLLPEASPTTQARRVRLDSRWFEAGIAAFWLVALEHEALTSRHATGPRALNVITVAVAALAVLGRRRHPWVFQLVVGCASIVLSNGLASRNYGTLFGVYGVLIPSYAVANWLPESRAAAAMALWVAGAVTVGVLHHADLAGTIGPLLAAAVACSAGLVMRSQRLLNAALDRASRQLEAERADRERLAIAGERARITRDLHAVVARGITAMIIDAEVAEQLLRNSEAEVEPPADALAAISSVEASGREVLTQLREILGVLRHGQPAAARSPQPGLDQIHQLIELSREGGRVVDFRIDGDPGTLLAGVDLVTYRILEDLLTETGSSLAVELRFGTDDLELVVTAPDAPAYAWPTSLIRERVALFDGEIALAPADSKASRLVVRLPRRVQGAFA